MKAQDIPGTGTMRTLYNPNDERDSCGIGFIAYVDGIPRHEVLEQGISILGNLEHRGAVGGDSKTGDGAGIMTAIPYAFFQSQLTGTSIPEAGDLAVGMFFLPKDQIVHAACTACIETVISEQGLRVAAWRRVPTDNSDLGAFAVSTEPAVYQLFIDRNSLPSESFPRKLYVTRRIMERALKEEFPDYPGISICSLSCSTIVYKGLLTGNQLRNYYPDLSDASYTSPYAIVHSRFSTNTLPQWRLAQPFRYIAHNGEFNTIQGNMHRQSTREGFMKSQMLGDDLDLVIPVIEPTGSDSSIFDNVLELFHMAGRSLPHVMMMMIPEAYAPEILMSEDKRAFYEYHTNIMEPWDGPAAVVFTDGRYIGATLDRNGLRPARYTITHDGRIIMASETGVLDLKPNQIMAKGRLQPGKMFLVDLDEHRIVPDNEIKAKISRQYPYRRWVKDRDIELRGLFMPSDIPQMNEGELLASQLIFGYTDEDLKTLIIPMAKQGQEAIGSMGNDTGLPVLSDNTHLLFSYFRQLFAQVTNPPIDPLREQLVMSLESYIQNESSPLDSEAKQYRTLKFNHPILSIQDMVRIRNNSQHTLLSVELDCTYPCDGSEGSLKEALDRVFLEAEEYAMKGYSLIILTDRNAGPGRSPIPSLLVSSGLHHYMISKKLRGRIGIIVETGETREVFHFALHIAFGTDAICPYIAYYTIRSLTEAGKVGDITPEAAADNYVNAIKKGLLKTFSRMGISTLHSFFGAQLFEALGLSEELINAYFPGTVSRIGGIGLSQINREVMERMEAAYPKNRPSPALLPAGSIYRYRKNGEKHYWTPQAIYKLQQSVKTDDYQVFKEFSDIMNGYYRENGEIRGLFKFKPQEAVALDEVESVESIMKRFVSAAMSIGSISRETHETIALAMNQAGAKSNSGEGGEDPERYVLDADGNSKRSRIKQIASGRFGVTTEYAVQADEMQIKMAQGAKPGEGGQLPGHKVSEYIAKIRHTTPGVTLISPPPHHDIYSIEDLAQLILDLRSVNPQSEISVKLVSEPGVGTVASGVAKARADRILVSGQNGGTGASPLTAIRHAGLPWELGLAEAQQSLIYNQLRSRVYLQVDGHLKTGKDLAIAALLGAEEFGFGTVLLICLGCVMMRKCHLNTCPVGVATQDPELRKRYRGNAVYIIRFMRFIAQEFREIMASLGFRSVDEMVGRVDLLDYQPAVEHWKASHISLEKILNKDHLAQAESLRRTVGQEQYKQTALAVAIDKLVEAFLESDRKHIEITKKITNKDRTIGAGISGKIIRRFGSRGLPDGSIVINLKGSAGQSFGAFLVPGITLRIEGDVNDYLGKSMSGGRIIVVPPKGSTFRADRNTICGNVVLYGATAGDVYINGTAGERFAVRNSGASAVVEGVGDHGCEYMTGGTVVVIGRTGKNFAAGMSGGIAYVYDPTELFDTQCNLDMVDLESVWSMDDRKRLHTLLSAHAAYTQSKTAKMILQDWEAQLPLFVKVIPIDYKQVLERMRIKEDRDGETLSVTEEVYDG